MTFFRPALTSCEVVDSWISSRARAIRWEVATNLLYALLTTIFLSISKTVGNFISIDQKYKKIADETPLHVIFWFVRFNLHTEVSRVYNLVSRFGESEKRARTNDHDCIKKVKLDASSNRIIYIYMCIQFIFPWKNTNNKKKKRKIRM